jgi:hypothetical protein
MITLYGTSQIGAGWLAMAKGDEKPMGTGTPRDGRTFTEAVWAAVELLREVRGVEGKVRIFAPGGERFTDVDTRGHVPAYGSLVWQAA